MTLAQDRLAKGLCPRCGEEAAPYRLCWRCRYGDVVRRCLNAGRKAGALSAVRDETDRRKALWSLTDAGKAKMTSWRFLSPYDPGGNANDGRRRPRLGRVPVDVERELVAIFETFNRGVTIEEVLAAWGRLRETRKHASVAGDMAALIAAQRRREARAEKRRRQQDAPDPIHRRGQ